MYRPRKKGSKKRSRKLPKKGRIFEDIVPISKRKGVEMQNEAVVIEVAVTTKRPAIVIKEDTAKSLGLSAGEAAKRVGVIMRKHKMPLTYFLSVLMEDGKPVIWTAKKIIECDLELITSKERTTGAPNLADGARTGRRFPFSFCGNSR